MGIGIGIAPGGIIVPMGITAPGGVIEPAGIIEPGEIIIPVGTRPGDMPAGYAPGGSIWKKPGGAPPGKDARKAW